MNVLVVPKSKWRHTHIMKHKIPLSKRAMSLVEQSSATLSSCTTHCAVTDAAESL